MHEVTMRMSDEAFDSVNHFIQCNPDIDIVKNSKSADNNEFGLDADELVKIATKIKAGDLSDFKKTTSEQIFKDIGI